MMQSLYKRVLLKISGEALMGEDPFGINQHTVKIIGCQVFFLRKIYFLAKKVYSLID